MSMTSLFPILKEIGLDDLKSRDFIEILEKGFLENAATKADIERIRSEMATKVELEKVRAEVEKVRAEVEKVRAEVEKVKAEVEKVKAEVQKLGVDMEKTKGETGIAIERAKSEILRWVFGAWATLFLGIIALLVKIL